MPINLQQPFENPLRVLVCYGKLKKMTSKHIWIRRYLFLFNDMVMIAEKRTNQFIVKQYFLLSDITIEDVPDGKYGTQGY